MLLSVDGGATKTFAVVYDDLNKKVAGIGVSGPSNVRSVSEDISKKNILKAMENALNMAGNPEINNSFFGIAGYGDSKYHSEMLNRIVSSISQNYIIENDGNAGTFLVTLGNDGVVTAIGTGSVGSYIINGVNHRIGGWSYLTDDCGSAYWISRKAIQLAEKSHDGLIDKTTLIDLIEEITGLGLRDAVAELENNFNKRFFASIAARVDELSYKDKIALNVLDLAYNEIELMLLGMSRHFNGKFIIGSVGGVMRSKHIRERLYKRFPGIKIFFGYHVAAGGILKMLSLKNGIDEILRDKIVSEIDQKLVLLSDAEKEFLFI
ncbi:BadF/BadG/BcrA/BcrD ATPase family protein [Picrophilus oshimae]|uniref:N-acetylglucosamine kinase n=1 Tax=Picrophilus torridus (strain ATCC 700027 / DSM 9790 / JCM 10055 / NBRC 100828 / KAW 2/3) TaxID=1122961 RepID=Q6L023_PICTO|nr:BadF/BadG/BcrA/BcrD ATPase family protein [Picrophilus oshimae]AAT43679.1 N-acetylglucosamine kinase [Picrophilus oshimae DSM 9789]